MNKLRKSFVLLLVLLVSTLAVAETTEEPVIGIVGRTDCGSFWRYDFNYETVDADGETPIVLSAAIFMTHDVHDKEIKAKGCGLINHYTITDDKERPTNVTDFITLEGVLANSNYIMIESDGFGFGIDVKRNQKYLQGRATARVNIDAFLAGRKLMEAEGYEFENVVLNLGYSQGGNSGMWVNRLVAEGYRSDELPKIDYCIIGGGPYDMYSHYRKLAEDNVSQYPVALPLILSGMIDAGGYKVKNEDKSLPLEKIVKPAFFDEESEPMKDIVYHLKENSLVYDSWKPEKTDKITFYHSPSDEVVPFLNQESMERHLLDNGYTSFDIDDSSTEGHTDTGKLYVMYTALLLSEFVPTGMEDVFREIPREATHDIYSIDGRLIRKQTTLREALRSLPKGVYVINGRKMVKD